jgi:nucleoside-diphosphate-sugar epimerase
VYEEIIESIRKTDKVLENPVIFIFLSSQLVYGNKHPGLKSEDDRLFPVSMYAKKCREMEKLLMARINNESVILRVPILYGNNSQVTGYKNIVSKFIDIARSGKNIKIYGKGKQCRTFLHINDLAVLMENIINTGIKNEILNASTGDFLSINDIANLIAGHFKVGVINNLEWPSNKLKLEAQDIKLSNKKAKSIFRGAYSFKRYIHNEKKL